MVKSLLSRRVAASRLAEDLDNRAAVVESRVRRPGVSREVSDVRHKSLGNVNGRVVLGDICSAPEGIRSGVSVSVSKGVRPREEVRAVAVVEGVRSRGRRSWSLSDIRSVRPGFRYCPCCSRELPESRFGSSGNKGDLQTYCQSCVALYQKFQAFRKEQGLFVGPELPLTYLSGYKFCQHCGRFLPVSSFGVSKGQPDGLLAQCRGCNSAYHRRRTSGEVKVSAYRGPSFVRLPYDPSFKYEGKMYCVQCGEWHDKSQFREDEHSTSGYYNTCRFCQSVLQSEGRIRVPEVRVSQHLKGLSGASLEERVSVKSDKAIRVEDRVHAPKEAVVCESESMEVDPRIFMRTSDYEKAAVLADCSGAEDEVLSVLGVDVSASEDSPVSSMSLVDASFEAILSELRRRGISGEFRIKI